MFKLHFVYHPLTASCGKLEVSFPTHKGTSPFAIIRVHKFYQILPHVFFFFLVSSFGWHLSVCRFKHLWRSLRCLELFCWLNGWMTWSSSYNNEIMIMIFYWFFAFGEKFDCKNCCQFSFNFWWEGNKDSSANVSEVKYI